MPMPILSCHSWHIAIFENMFLRPRSVYVESSPQARSCPWCDPLQAAQSNCGTFPRMFKPTILYQEPSQPSRATEQATGNTTRKSKNCPCPLCDKLFRNNRDLRSHFVTHTGEKPFPCNFDGCEKRFAREGDLKRHKRIHTDARPYECEICDMAFKRKDHLNNHKNVHLPPHDQAARQARLKRYPCPLCNKLFRNNRDLRSHFVTHTGEKAFPCNFDGCEKRFGREKDLKRHKLIHTGSRPHKCEICNKTFTRKYLLKKHKTTHLGRPLLWDCREIWLGQ